MNQSIAKIINPNINGLAIVASAARMSTQQGTAMDVFARSGDHQKDMNLVGKVLASGHKSVIEHQTLSVAFNDVSVFIVQYDILFVENKFLWVKRYVFCDGEIISERKQYAKY